MKTYFALGAAALLAAVFVFAPQSFADCSPGTPGCPQPTPICPPDKPACWIIPPQSIEVNAGGVSAGAGAPGSGGAPVVLTPAQYRIEIPLVTPGPFSTPRPAATAGRVGVGILRRLDERGAWRVEPLGRRGFGVWGADGRGAASGKRMGRRDRRCAEPFVPANGIRR